MARQRRGASRKVVERQKPRWVGRLVSVVLLTGALSIVGWGLNWIQQPQNLPLNSVRVLGEIRHLERDELHQVIAPYASEGFIGVDLPELGEALESLAWVDSVTIRRSWPAALDVTIKEQQPLARWGEKGLLNNHGEFFAVAVDAFSSLPVLNGPDGSQAQMAEHYAAMGRVLAPAGLKIERLEMDQRRSMAMALTAGPELLLGRSNGYERLLRFVRIYPQVFAKRMDTIEQLDLRYTNGLAVQWREGFAPEVV